MKTKLNDFLNEYGGPGRTIGFRYFEPKNKYDINIPIIIDTDMIDILTLTEDVEQILIDKNIEEDSFEFVEIDDTDEYLKYILNIKLTAYSKYEVQSMINTVLDNVVELYKDEVESEKLIIIGDKISTSGPDLNDKSKKIGYK